MTEAIVNAVVHRGYTSNASVQVMLFADRLEIWNPGELPPSLTPERLREPHAWIPRNPLIAEPLYLVRYIEKAGSGTLAKGTPFAFLHSCDDSGWKGTKCSRRWRQITSQGRSYHWACDAKRSRIILFLKLLSLSFPPYRFGTSTDEFTDTDPIR